MADWKRTEVSELKSKLSDPATQRDPVLYQKTVQKVIASMTFGDDVSSLFSDMIKAGSTQNFVQKKMVYLYLCNYAASNSELTLMTLNTLQKDLEDHNAMLRGLALRTLCSLRLPELVQYLPEPLQDGLKDVCPYVRKTAVLGVLKLFYLDPNRVEKMNFVDILYQMLRDRDPQVVSNCIAALSEILASEGGMVVNTKIAHYLLNRLQDFSEWDQCKILDLLARYEPSSEDEVFDILNILDDRLKHPNSGVVLATIRLFLHFTRNMSNLQRDVCSRLKSPMLTFLRLDYTDLVYTYLLHAELILTRHPEIWRQDYETFYCRYTDPLHIKLKKIQLLASICMFESTNPILEELSAYATDVNTQVARYAIQAVGKIALNIPAKANLCVGKLLSLLTHEADYIISEALTVMTKVLRKFDNMLESILPKLPVTSKRVRDPEGKAALIWILGEYGESLPNAPYILEEVVDEISDESSDVKLQLLSAIMKMFFKRPPECQEMLGRLLDYSINEDGSQDVRDRGMLYYRLLRTKNTKIAKQVVCGQPKVVNEEAITSGLSPLLVEFNTLSVMFSKSSREFITQRYPYITSTESESRGAEANFEVARDPSSAQSFSAVVLDPNITISAGEFEEKWLKLPITKELHMHLESVPAQGNFIKALSARHIMTMASSPSSQPVVKYFFYAKHLSSLHHFLLEVNIAVENSMMSCLLKCENPKQGASFMRHFLHTLGYSGQPTSLLQWKTCSDIPTRVKDACGVFYNNQLHIGGGSTGNARGDSMVYAYSPDLDIWKVLPPSPLRWFTMAVWNKHLLLIGGSEERESLEKPSMSKKVAVWKNGEWCFSLPPMKIARVSPTAVSHGGYLAVFGGRRGYLGYSVEVLESETSTEWLHTATVPLNPSQHTTTLCGDNIYLLHQKSGKILQANTSTFVQQRGDTTTTSSNSDTQQRLSKSNTPADQQHSDSEESHSSESITSDIDTANSLWQALPKPPVPPLQVASVGGYLVVFSHGNSGDGNLTIHAYFPETGSWYQIGKFPGISSGMTCVASPDKHLYIAGGDTINSKFSQKMFKVVTKTRTTVEAVQ